MADNAGDAILRAIQGELGEIRRDIGRIDRTLATFSEKFEEISQVLSGMMWMLTHNLGRTNDNDDRLDRIEAMLRKDP